MRKLALPSDICDVLIRNALKKAWR